MRLRRLLLLMLVLLVPPLAAAPLGEPPEGLAAATFAGGCFWCVEEAFDPVDGVRSTTSGYTGGDTADPSYGQVAAGRTRHAEAVRVVYDPGVVGYGELLEVFWHNIDPTVENRQFCDKGAQYRSAIFYHTPEQRRLAEETRARIDESGRLPAPVVTEIVKAGPFYVAEEYHQDYYEKNPIRYKFYKTACGRQARLEQLWGSDAR